MVRFCKVLAVIAYLLGFIVGITSCRATMYESIGFLTGILSALFCWLVAFVVGSVFMVLAHVLERVSALESSHGDSLNAMRELEDQLKVVRRSVEGESEPVLQPPPVARRIAQRPDTWTCKKCRAINQRTDLACRDCGAYR